MPSSSSSSTVIHSFPHPNNTGDTLPLRLSPSWWRCRFLAFFSLLGEEMVGDLATPRKAAREAGILLDIVADYARLIKFREDLEKEEEEKKRTKKALLQDKSNQQVKIAGRTLPSELHGESKLLSSNQNQNQQDQKSNSKNSSKKYSSVAPPPVQDPASLFPNHLPMFSPTQQGQHHAKKAWEKCLRRIFYHSILTPEERKQHNLSIEDKMMKLKQERRQERQFGSSRFDNDEDQDEDQDEFLLTKLMPLPPQSALPSDEQMEACLRRIFWVERIAAFYVCSNVSVPRDHASVDGAVGQLLLEGHSYQEIWERVQRKYSVFVIEQEKEEGDDDDDVVKKAYAALNAKKNYNNGNNNNMNASFNSNGRNRSSNGKCMDACTQTTNAFIGSSSYQLSRKQPTATSSTTIQGLQDQDEVDAIAQRMMLELGSNENDDPAMLNVTEQENHPTITTRAQRLTDTITAANKDRESVDSAFAALGLQGLGKGSGDGNTNNNRQEQDDEQIDAPPPPFPDDDDEDQSSRRPPSFEEQSVERDHNNINNNNNNNQQQDSLHQLQQQREKEKQEKDELKVAAMLLASMQPSETQEPFDATKILTLKEFERRRAFGGNATGALANSSTFLPLELRKKLHQVTSVASKVPLSGGKGGLDDLRRKSILEEQGRRAARLKMVDPHLMIDDDDDDEKDEDEKEANKNNGNDDRNQNDKKSSSSEKLLAKLARQQQKVNNATTTTSSSSSPADLSGTSMSSYSHFNYDDFVDPVTGVIPFGVIKSLSSTKKGTGEFERLVTENEEELQQQRNKAYKDPYQQRMEFEESQQQQNQHNHQQQTIREQQNMLSSAGSFSKQQQSSAGVYRFNFHVSGVVKSQLISQRHMPTASLIQLIADFEEALTRVYDRIRPEGTQLNYILPNSTSPAFTFMKPPSSSSSSSNMNRAENRNSVRCLALNCLACNSGVAECVQVNVAICGKQRPIALNLLKVCAAEVLRVLAGHHPLFPSTSNSTNNNNQNNNNNNNSSDTLNVDMYYPKPLHLRSALGYPSNDGTVSFCLHDFDASFNGVDDLINSEEKQKEQERAEILQKQLSMQQSLSPMRSNNNNYNNNNNNNIDSSMIDQNDNTNNNNYNLIEQRVRNYYALVDPSKLPNVPAVLEKYKGKEEQLMENLVAKYGRPEPTQTQQEIQLRQEESHLGNNNIGNNQYQQQQQQQQHQQPNNNSIVQTPSTSTPSWSQRLHKFYSKHDPSKISNIPSILERYKGREQEMMQQLKTKYNCLQDDDDDEYENIQQNQLLSTGTMSSSSHNQQQHPSSSSSSSSLPALKMRKLLGLPNHHYLLPGDGNNVGGGGGDDRRSVSSVASSSSPQQQQRQQQNPFDIESIIQQQTSSSWKGPKLPPSKLYANKYAEL